MTHTAHRMHDNSLAAHRKERPKLSTRAERIYSWVGGHGLSTDRDVLRGLNYSDMNQVRPRITELVDANLLEEVDKVRCPITHHSVRRVRVRTTTPAQLELIC
jgi:hypothetical protein